MLTPLGRTVVIKPKNEVIESGGIAMPDGVKLAGNNVGEIIKFGTIPTDEFEIGQKIIFEDPGDDKITLFYQGISYIVFEYSKIVGIIED